MNNAKTHQKEILWQLHIETNLNGNEWNISLVMRIVACLCMHPIGYYADSWAGALCPTDDVITHLLLMRSEAGL